MINVRIKVGDLRNDLREAATEWIRSLGLNPAELSEWMLIRYQPGENRHDGKHVLHLSKRRLAEGGGMVLDQATGDIVSEPLVIELTPEQWADRPTLGIEAVH